MAERHSESGQGPMLPEEIRPLFWDHDSGMLQWRRDRDFIIGRVLAAGTWDNIRWLRGASGTGASAARAVRLPLRPLPAALEHRLARRTGRPFPDVMSHHPDVNIGATRKRRPSRGRERPGYQEAPAITRT